MENYDAKKDERKENIGEEANGFDEEDQQQLAGAAAIVSLNELPEGCIAKILSATTPADACRLSCLSSTFSSAAASDSVWSNFLPSDYQTILSGSSWAHQPDSSSLTFPSKKHLFFHLSHNHILIDQGKKSFSLDKWSGKKCYMIAPRDLVVIWGDTPEYWDWISIPESRFEEVAKLNYVWWFEIRGKMSTSMLSPDTNYGAYLVFKLREEVWGFDFHPVKVSLTLGFEKICEKSVVLDPMIKRTYRQGILYWFELEPLDHGFLLSLERSKERADGWLEIELGVFLNKHGEDELEMSIMEVEAGIVKGGLVIQGVEIRPKK